MSQVPRQVGDWSAGWLSIAVLVDEFCSSVPKYQVSNDRVRPRRTRTLVFGHSRLPKQHTHTRGWWQWRGLFDGLAWRLAGAKPCVGLDWVGLDCTALQCVAMRCITLHCVALLCIALHCVALRASRLEGPTLALRCAACLAPRKGPTLALCCVVLYCVASLRERLRARLQCLFASSGGPTSARWRHILFP